MSAAIIFSEITGPVHFKYPDILLSPLGWLLRITHTPIVTFLLSFLFIMYMSYATFKSVFEIKIPFLNYYPLYNGKRSDTYSIKLKLDIQCYIMQCTCADFSSQFVIITLQCYKYINSL